MTTKRPKETRPMCEKIAAVQRVNDGESKASVARDIEVNESTLRGWCTNKKVMHYFMTSRMSSSDTNKSNDGEPPAKRARTESPAAAPQSPTATGLDLSNQARVTHNVPQPAVPTDTPVQHTTKRIFPPPPLHTPRVRCPDLGVSLGLPLSGLGHLQGLAHSRFGSRYSETTTNQYNNPGLAALKAHPASRALCSVRSPKPAHSGMLNLTETRHRSRSNHTSDLHRQSSSNSSRRSQSSSSQPVDDMFLTFCYYYNMLQWFLTQQAILSNLTEAAAKPVTTAPLIPSSFEWNNNNLRQWQYLSPFGSEMTLPEEKLKSASQVPKDQCAGKILYSRLTKGQTENSCTKTSTVQNLSLTAEVRETITAPAEQRVAEPAVSPEVEIENNEPATKKPTDNDKIHKKKRTVFDNPLFNSSNQTAAEENKSIGLTNGERDPGTAEEIEHGEKFLAWLETIENPSLTQVHLHQLHMLLVNLRTRYCAAPATPADTSGRK